MLHLCYISPTLPVEFPFVQHAWTLGVVPLPTSVETPMSSVPVNLAAKPSSHQHFYLGSKPWNHSQSWVVKRVVDDTGKTPSHGWLWHSFYRFYPHIFFWSSSAPARYWPTTSHFVKTTWPTPTPTPIVHRGSALWISERSTKNMVVNKYKG